MKEREPKAGTRSYRRRSRFVAEKQRGSGVVTDAYIPVGQQQDLSEARSASRRLLPESRRSQRPSCGSPGLVPAPSASAMLRRMSIWIGTSGYNYPEWKGSFYPEKLPAAKMLPYYAERLSTVEINYTYYRMPTPKILDGWDRATPDRFKLTLKAPKRITHDARLVDCADPVAHFTKMAAALGSKLGALLFQLPPNFKIDLPRFDAFLETLPHDLVAAFEFRNASWLDDAIYDRLRARNLALCIADSEKLTTPTIITAPYAYFRLRDEGYGREEIERWAAEIQSKAAACDDVYVYFKHEESGKGPEFARLLSEALGF
jgi:uncharacterized protein YecE (DUF72 family)